MIPRIWGIDEVRIKDVGRNVFVCQFRNLRDKRKVVNEGPWFFDKGILSLEEMWANASIGELEFRFVSFWIHLHDLLVASFSKELAKALGNTIGKFEKLDCDEDGLCWGHSLRTKVSIDVTKPLCRGVFVKVGSMADEWWIHIKYKKLPDFCYGCGKFDHVLKDCLEHLDEEGSQLRSWLRENPF